MSKEKILFAEDKKYYINLGVINYFDRSKYILEFNGMKYYKISDKEIKEYSAVVSFNYTSPLVNFLILKAKKNGIKTILMSDGIIDWANLFDNPKQKKYDIDLYHPIIHDYFFCLGEEEKDYFDFLGNNTEQYMLNRIIPNKDKLDLPNNEKFLITTANTAYFNDSERDHLEKILKKVIKILDEMNINYIFRIFDEYLINNLDIQSENNYDEGNFDSVLSKVDFVITTPSSITINAMYHDRPVAQLIYRDTPMFVQSGWNINMGNNIEQTINSLLKKDKNRINFQNWQVEKYINVKSEKKMIDVLDSDDINGSNKIENFININLYNLINSKYNFNLEYFVRKVYLKFKKNKYFKKLLNIIDNL
jgi:hypothetical protein